MFVLEENIVGEVVLVDILFVVVVVDDNYTRE
jgi:hypothetical protein